MRLVIVGHGLRDRTVLGPVDHEDQVGQAIEFGLRRYRCRACSSVLSVVPREVVFRRRYSAYAIAWALALFGLLGLAVTGVRECVTGWRAESWTTNLSWAALKRWTWAVRDQRLFPSLPRAAPSASIRQIAHRAAMALAGEAPLEQRGLGEDLRAAYGGIAVGMRSMAA